MFSRKKVLVVEDNALNRSLLCQILRDQYDVMEAENGQKALAVLKEYGEGISLILLDIIMPVMDGYTFLSIAKADPAYSSIPVIVTTQNDAESDEVAALSHGAADFVAKPYKPQVILHRAAGIIKLRETAAMVNLIQYDRLTGLYSKEYFYGQVRNVLLCNPDKQYDLICSDIENFKLINDVFGVKTGDRLLKGIGRLYEERMGSKAVYGRLDSDRFACLIEHQQEYTNDMFVKVNAQVNELLEIHNIVIKWGIYFVQDRKVSVEQMCDRAILSARSMKGRYGKHFAVYDDTLRNHLLKEQAITDSMEAALLENQFLVWFQPKYRMLDKRLIGAEALVRWNHPQWGLLSPAEFIPLFEKNGFITKLDQFVWDKACAALRSWDEQGLNPVSVSVNVSRADIYNQDLADILVNIVKSYGLSPSRLHLEITETAYTVNSKQMTDTVSRLQEQGFIIEMDDFGSGYSSLNMLCDMPINILKLDIRFIHNEMEKPKGQGILKFIMALARWMHLSVVAEGVETKEQLIRLRELGCDYVQGYYFAKPMPSDDFEAVLKEDQRTGEAFCFPEADWQALYACDMAEDSFLEQRTGVVCADVPDAVLGEQLQKEKLASALACERQANEAKSNFLSRISHEIRTPMNAIIGMSTIAAQSLGNEKQVQDCILKIGISSRFLLSLMNDILDMSRIESGKMILKNEKIIGDEFLRGVNSICQIQAAAKGVDYECIPDPALEASYMGDGMRLEQVLVNIVSNAIKFTEEKGKVTLISSLQGRTDKDALLRFIVKDTGVGMSGDFISHIFEPFAQEYTGSTNLHGGAGLGLAISKSIVDMMGGSITVNSARGKGTEFTVEVRLGLCKKEKEEQALLSQPRTYDFKDRRVLLAEDNMINAEVALMLLEGKGFHIDRAENGQKALRLFAKSKNGYYDAILMDIRMPLMDGLSAARIIRKLPNGDAGSIPIIAMTANAFEEDIRKSMEAGMNAHLAKPIEPEELFRTLYDFIYGRKE